MLRKDFNHETQLEMLSNMINLNFRRLICAVILCVGLL